MARKYNGIREAMLESKELWGGLVLQISYDTSDDTVLTNLHASQQSWSEYADPDIITVMYTTQRVTIKAIKAAITQRLENQRKR